MSKLQIMTNFMCEWVPLTYLECEIFPLLFAFVLFVGPLILIEIVIEIQNYLTNTRRNDST